MTMTDPAKPIIAVGIGNSSVQVGFFQSTASLKENPLPIPIPVRHLSFEVAGSEWSGPEGLAEAIPDGTPKDTPWFVASVNRKSAANVSSWVSANFPKANLHMLKNSQFPIEILTDRPEKVGTDRIAAATAVRQLKGENTCAVFVDAGTAITVNALDHEGRFLGGAILPGTTTASRALNKSTDQLPEVLVRADQPEPDAIGSDTHPAIASGVYWGSIGAVQMLIGRMFAELPSMLAPRDVFVTGGFGAAIARRLQAKAIYVPHLVLSGIALAAANI